MQYGDTTLENQPPTQGAAAKVDEEIFFPAGAPITSAPEKAFAPRLYDLPIQPEAVTRETSIAAAPENHLSANKQNTTSEIVKPYPLAKPEISSQGQLVKPGEYHPGYCEEMLAFFDRPKYTTIEETFTWKNGSVDTRMKKVPTAPPEFSEFARRIGVNTATLKRWAKSHPDFRDAYETCKEIYEEFLVHHGLLGNYGAIFGKFVAVNRTKMKDKQIHENRIVDMRKVLDDIAAGKVLPGGTLPSEDSEDNEDEI